MTQASIAQSMGFLNDLYPRVQQFYADQMQLLDTGDTQAWACTFTEDGTFTANRNPEPVIGRAEIGRVASQTAADYAAKGIQRRHWLGMVAVDARDDSSLEVRSYALIIATERGGAPVVQASTSCDDILVPDGGSWLVKSRTVLRDDLR